MKSEKSKNIFEALVILLLCVPFSLHAAMSDEFIQGYASAVLEREFHLRRAWVSL